MEDRKFTKKLLDDMTFFFFGKFFFSHTSSKEIYRVLIYLFMNLYVSIPSTTQNIWDKVFKNGLSKICGMQSLKSLK